MKINENIYTFRTISSFTAVTLSLLYLFQKYATVSPFPRGFMDLNKTCIPTSQMGKYSFTIDPDHPLLQDEDFLSSRLFDLVATSESGAINSLSRRDKKNLSDEKVQKLIQENFEARFKKGLDRELSIMEWKKDYDITIATTYILKESDDPDTYYGKLTADNHRTYAKHWGLNWRIVTDNLLKGKCTLENGTIADCVPYWNKIEVSRDYLKEPANPMKQEVLVTPDHDMIFTNMDVNPYEQFQLLRKGLNTSIIVGIGNVKWKNGTPALLWEDGDPDISIGTGIMFLRKDEQSKEFFDRVWEKRDNPTGSNNSVCSTLGTCQTQEFLHEQEAFARVLEDDRSLLNTVVGTIMPKEVYQGKKLNLDTGKREGCFILINPKPGQPDGPLSFWYDNTYPEDIWKVGDWIGHTPGVPVKALDCDTKEPVYLRETYLKALIKATIPIDTPDPLPNALSATKNTSRYKDPVWIDLLSRVSATSQEYALIDACRKDDIGIVENLLKNGSISEQYRVWGILAAASNGSLKSLELLLTSGVRIADAARGSAMIRAAERGHKEILIRLFKDGGVFDQDLYWAVKQAAVNGHADALDFLLSSKVVPSHELGAIVEETAKTFYSDAIEILLDYATIYGLSEKHRGLAVWRASNRGCTNTVKALLENGPISNTYRQMALSAAVSKGYSKIVELLS